MSSGLWGATIMEPRSLASAICNPSSVYDVRPGEQVSVSLVAGRSNIERDDPNPFAPSDGINRAALMTASWRSAIGSHTVVTQRVSTVTHDFLNRDQAGGPVSRGSNAAGAWRGDIAHALAGGVLEAGGQVRRVMGSRRGSIVDAHQRVIETSGASELDASWLERAGYGVVPANNRTRRG